MPRGLKEIALDLLERYRQTELKNLDQGSPYQTSDERELGRQILAIKDEIEAAARERRI